MLKKMILTYNNGEEEFIQDSYNRSIVIGERGWAQLQV